MLQNIQMVCFNGSESSRSRQNALFDQCLQNTKYFLVDKEKLYQNNSYIYFSFVPRVKVQANPKFNSLKSFFGMRSDLKKQKHNQSNIPNVSQLPVVQC